MRISWQAMPSRVSTKKSRKISNGIGRMRGRTTNRRVAHSTRIPTVTSGDNLMRAAKMRELYSRATSRPISMDFPAKRQNTRRLLAVAQQHEPLPKWKWCESTDFALGLRPDGVPCIYARSTKKPDASVGANVGLGRNTRYRTQTCTTGAKVIYSTH